MGRWRGRCVLPGRHCRLVVLGGTDSGPPKVPDKNVGFKDVDRWGLVQFCFGLLRNAALRGLLRVVLRVDSRFQREHSHLLRQHEYLVHRPRPNMGSYFTHFPEPQSCTLDSEQAC
jgi:hypothetical protein